MMKHLYLSLFLLLTYLPAQRAGLQSLPVAADEVPVLDGDTRDWSCVPDSYTITEAAMKEDEGKHAAQTPKPCRSA